MHHQQQQQPSGGPSPQSMTVSAGMPMMQQFGQMGAMPAPGTFVIVSNPGAQQIGTPDMMNRSGSGHHHQQAMPVVVLMAAQNQGSPQSGQQLHHHMQQPSSLQASLSTYNQSGTSALSGSGSGSHMTGSGGISLVQLGGGSGTNMMTLGGGSGTMPFMAPTMPAISEGSICKDFLAGRCTRPACRFVHLPPHIRPFPDEVCRDYVRGSCTRGTCRFFHGSPQDLAQMRANHGGAPPLVVLPQSTSPLQPPPQQQQQPLQPALSAQPPLGFGVPGY